jgi:hypothetical protein
MPKPARLSSSIEEKSMPGLNDFPQLAGSENGSTVNFFINLASTFPPKVNRKAKAIKTIRYDLTNIFLIRVSISINIDTYPENLHDNFYFDEEIPDLLKL